jgi:hypothetical protein
MANEGGGGNDRAVKLARIPVSRIVPHFCGMPKRLRDKRLLMLTAFFDESGLNPTTDRVLS